jgi:hypothetical protein
MELLSQYNYNIVYHPSSQNGATDALSSRAELAPTDLPEETPQTMMKYQQTSPACQTTRSNP